MLLNVTALFFFYEKKIESHETSHSKSNNNRTRRIYKQGLVIVSLNSCGKKVCLSMQILTEIVQVHFNLLLYE